MDFRISSAQSKNTSDCNKMSSLGHAPRPYSTSPNTLPTTTRIGNWEHFMTAKQQRGTGRTFFNGSRDETDSSSRQSRHDTERRIGSSTNTNATPANNTHLGAEVSCVTTTGNASLLPTVIVNALNSRVKRSSQFSRDHSTLASVQPASPPRISSSVSQRASAMGHNMNAGGTATSGCSESLDQSRIAQDDPALTTSSTVEDKPPMTNNKDSNTAPPKPQRLLFGSFDPDAYGKPARLRQGLQERTVRQGSATLATMPRDVPSPDDIVAVPNNITKSYVLPLAEASSTFQPDSLSTVPREDMSVATQPRLNMKPDQASMDKNGDSESTKRKTGKKGRRGWKENKRPGEVGLLDKVTTHQPESQAQKLARLQNQEIVKVGLKIRQQSAEPTTSPQALILARKTSSYLETAEVAAEAPALASVAVLRTIAAESTGTKHITTLQKDSGVQVKVPGSSQEQPKGSVKSSNIGMRGRQGARFQNGGRNHWASTAEIKPPPAPERSIDSNAFGSEIPSDADTASGDSVAPMENGRQLRKNRPAAQDAPLADWSGNWMPPPIEWSERPRFNNNCTQFIGHCGHWNEATAAQSVNVDTRTPFTRLSRDLVEDSDLHPDGLDLIDRTITVDVDTADQYGYSEDAKEAIKRDAMLVGPDVFTDDWGKLDLTDPNNRKYRNESCEDLVRNYNENKAKERQQEIDMQRAQKLARKQAGPYVPAPNPHTPRINIYLRPAIRSDIPQMQDIYNHYVQKSVHTSEIHPITYNEMQDRWTASTDEKLPFIVAVSKSAKINREIGNAVEKIVGWASATDWVNQNSAERFTVELDMYVHPDHRHQGIGKCLMDKLIDSTDRGHIVRRGYPFTCAPEERHAYSAGGARNLMKLRLHVSSFDKPRNPLENDIPWIKKWLTDEWNFEQQGYTPKCGVKFKRYVNFTCFVRSTSYTPKECEMPEDSP